MATSTTTKVTTESDKTTVTTQVKNGAVTGSTQVSTSTDGTISTKTGVDLKLPKVTIGVSTKTGLNSTTGESSTGTELELSKKFESPDIGGTKWTGKANIVTSYDESSKTSALDPGISIVKTDLGTSLKVSGSVTINDKTEFKAGGSVGSLGASEESLKVESGAKLVSSTVGTATVFGQSLGSNLMSMKPEEFATAYANNANRAATIELNMKQMDKDSPLYQKAASDLAKIEQTSTNLKTAEVFNLAERAEASIKSGSTDWQKTTVDGGRSVMWENKTTGEKLVSDRGAERVILVRGDGTGEAFSYTNPSGTPSESFKFESGAATKINLVAGGMVQVTDGSQQLLALGTNGLAMSDSKGGAGQGVSKVWELNEDGKYEQRFIDGVIKVEGAGAIDITTYNSNYSNEGRNSQNADSISTDTYNFPNTAGAGRGVVNPEAPETKPPFNPLTSSGVEGNSYTIKQGDDLWKIGKSLGLNDQENTRLAAEVAATSSGGNASDLKIGNTIAIPKWAQDISDAKIAASKTDEAINGHDLPAPQANTDGASQPTPPTAKEIADAAYEQLVNAFTNPPATPPLSSGTNLASLGGGTMTDAGLMSIGGAAGTSLQATTSVPSQPSPLASTDLTPAQQTALAAQLTAAGLTPEGTQVIPLQSGGYFIVNSEGGIVGNLDPVGTSGLVAYTATGGATQILSPSGTPLTALEATLFDTAGIDLATPPAQNTTLIELQTQLDAQAITGGLNGYNAAMALGNAVTNWEHLSDAQRASAVLNAYNSIPNQTSDSSLQSAAVLSLYIAATSLGNWSHQSDLQHAQTLTNLLSSGNAALQSFGVSTGGFGSTMGDIGQALNLVSALQHHDNLGALSSLNLLTDKAIDKWIDSAISDSISNIVADTAGDAAFNAAADAAVDAAASSAVAEGVAGSTVPYVGIVMALSNIEGHPGQAIGSIIGTMYFGPIGGMIGGMIGGALDSMFGGHSDPPPPPVGIAAMGWTEDDSGHMKMTVSTEYSVSGGGTNACALAKNVCSLLDKIVESVNAKNQDTPEGHLKDIAINPYCVPKFGADRSGSWIETVQADGSTAREIIVPETFSTRLIEILQQNGGLAPAWQVETIKARYQQEAQSDPQEARAHAAAGAGGHANHGNQAFALQGNAVESADFKTQTYGALIVSGITTTLEQIKTLQVLRDVEQDSYLEKTQWVSGTDANGKPQGILVIDFDGNGQIETRDILNLNGNAGQAGNPTDEAREATASAALQRNNANWLDANGDHILDKSDPAFAAIKLFIDTNNNGQNETGEARSLSQAGIESINLATGQVTYTDGHKDQLTAKTLTADTEGFKLTKIQEVQADGTLKTLDAGTVLEHEGYQGQIKVTDDGGTRWGTVRKQTYEQDAKVTGDWEGTADEAAHRHGGGNVLADGTAAPTETTATGTISTGKLKTAVQKPNVQEVIAAGDIRIKSSAALGFIPIGALADAGGQAGQSPIQQVTDSMIQSAGSGLFGGAAAGGGGTTSLGALGAVGSGMAVQSPVLVSAPPSPQPSPTGGEGANTASPINANPVFVPTYAIGGSTQSGGGGLPEPTTFVAAGLTNFQSTASTSGTAPTAPTVTAVVTTSFTSDVATVPTSAVIPAQAGIQTSVNPVDSRLRGNDNAGGNGNGGGQGTTAPVLEAPQVRGETLAGTEDIVLRLPSSTLLANDTSANAAADPSKPILTITAVANPTHGQVGLNNGDVIFLPDANFHGTASFTYTVTDQYGLQSTATATLDIAAVNDAPVTTGETGSTTEDNAVYFNIADLLQNDTDVDIATDGQTLSISGIASSSHGTATLTGDGRIKFVPDANFHGLANFTYLVSDGNGGQDSLTMPAKVLVQVAAVNDAPVATGEIATISEDNAIILTQAQLLANDTDNDTATDGQTLSISAVSGAANGTVTMLANGDIQFIPNSNYHGQAQFTYTVSDGNGGTANANVNLTVLAVNDAPVARGEAVSGAVEDTTLAISAATLLANDTDVDTVTDGQALSIQSVSNATHGTVSLVTLANGQQQINFAPDANYHGAAQFSYWTHNRAKRHHWQTQRQRRCRPLAHSSAMDKAPAPLIAFAHWGQPLAGYVPYPPLLAADALALAQTASLKNAKYRSKQHVNHRYLSRLKFHCTPADIFKDSDHVNRIEYPTHPLPQPENRPRLQTSLWRSH
jgi:Cadherin-like domain